VCCYFVVRTDLLNNTTSKVRAVSEINDFYSKTVWHPIKPLEFHIIVNVYCYGPNKVTDVRRV